MVIRTELPLLLIAIVIIPALAGQNGKNKNQSESSPIIARIPVIGVISRQASPAQKIKQAQLDNVENGNPSESILIRDQIVKTFITETSNTKLISALVPFSAFGEAGAALIQSINSCIYHERYDVAMDAVLYPVVKNLQILINTAYPDVVIRKDGFKFIYKFLEDYMVDLIKSINALNAKKNHFMKDKVIANYLSNVFFAAQSLKQSISAFVKENDIRYEITRLTFEFKSNPDLTIERARGFVVGLVQSMTIIDDMVENRYRYVMPLDRMTIFGDMLVVLTTLFDVVLKSANADLAMMMHRVLYQFLSLQNDSTSFIVSEFSKTGIFTISLENRNFLIKEILALNDFTTRKCIDKQFEIYCTVLSSHTSQLFDTLGNYLVEATDGTAKNYLLNLEPPSISLEDQDIPEKVKLTLDKIAADLINISSPLFHNKNSFISVYLKTMINASMKIIKNYEQSEPFLHFFAKLYTSITKMLRSSVKQKKLNSKGEMRHYYLYDPKKCIEVKSNLEIYGIFFGYRVLLNRSDMSAKSSFFRTLVSVLEAWKALNGDMEQGPEICSEPVAEFNADSDSESEINPSSIELMLKQPLDLHEEEGVLPFAEYPEFVNEMVNDTLYSHSKVEKDQPVIPLVDTNNNEIHGQTEVDVVKPVKKLRRKVIVFVEHLNCRKCYEDRILMEFVKKTHSKFCPLV